MNQRKKKILGSVITTFDYGPAGELLYETDGTTTRAYVYLNGIPLARIDNGTAIYYYHTDHLGTPQAMTDSTGTTVWAASYAPFGNANVTTATITNNLRFPGQYYDAETGLHYNWNRYYDPKTGRYITSDPIGLRGGLNTYLYVRANPLRRIDPRGLSDVVFNPQDGTVAVTDKDGAVVEICPAANNADSTSRGAWEPGVYPFLYYVPHADDASADSAYGSNGNFVFDLPGCQGCGVHSGRANSCDKANRCGVKHATMGCIRTTDKCTGAMKRLNSSGDPLKNLYVVPRDGEE